MLYGFFNLTKYREVKNHIPGLGKYLLTERHLRDSKRSGVVKQIHRLKIQTSK